MAKETQLCIYCGSLNNLTDEHLLPKALGGNLIAKIVCESCNNKLSSVDQALSQNSIIALARVAHEGGHSYGVKIAGPHRVHQPDLDLFLEIEIINGFTPRILPQVHMYNGGLLPYAENKEDLYKLLQFLKNSSSETLAKTHKDITLFDNVTTPRFVIRGKNSVSVIARSDEDAQELLNLLIPFKNQFAVAAHTRIQPGPIIEPNVDFAAHLNLNRAHRGIAKIAYNFLAYVVGAKVMLGPSLDPIRNYILGNDLQLAESPNNDEIPLDTRFVDWHPEPEARQKLPPQNTHQILLAVSPTLTYARVILYNDHTYFVDFQTLEVTLDRSYIFEFSSDRSIPHHEVDLEEFCERLWKKKAE
jgi:HNH endonuclease